MKIHLNTPQNPDVFGQNVTTWNLAKSFQAIGTILGAATELAVLYAAIIAHIAAMLPVSQLVRYSSIALSLLLVVFLARERIRTGRQAAKILTTKEGRGLGNIANAAILISFVLVYGASLALSYMGAVQGVNSMLPDAPNVNTQMQDSTLMQYKKEANAQYLKDSAAIATNYKLTIAATKQQYNPNIAAWQRKKKEDTTPAGQEWANKQINKLTEERDSKVNALIAEKNSRLTDALTTKRAGIQVYENQTAQEKQLKLDGANRKTQRLNWFADKAGNIIPVFICISLLLLAVGLFLEEKFKQASGIKEVVLPNKYDLMPSLSEEIKETAAIVGGSWARSIINGVKKLKTNPEIDKTMDELIELKINSYRKAIYSIGNDPENGQEIPENTQKPAKIGFKMPEKQPKTPENTYKTPENPEITPENPKPGAHLRRIFNKKGVGETFYPEQEPIKPAFPDENPGTGKIITLDFAARQMATWKSHLKNGTRTPEKAGPLYKYWSFIFDEMKTKGLASMQVPVFTPDEWQ